MTLTVGTQGAVVAEDPPTANAPVRRGPVTTSRGHIRGSMMLLMGRLTSLSLTFVTQIMTVRYLSKSDYGAFAYALAFVLLLQSFLAVGLDRADTRFLCLYEERRDRGRFLGVLVTEALTIISLGVVAVTVVVMGRDALFAGGDGRTVTSLIVVTVLLAPAQALDNLAVNAFAVMAHPRAVFMRRYLLEPALRLAVVLAVVTFSQPVMAMAIGYVIAAGIVLVVYATTLVGVLRRSAIVQERGRMLTLPLRDLFGFSVPLLTTNLTFAATTTLGVVVLGQVSNIRQVAAFRAVQPVAAMNLMVMLAFATLFTPVAARLHARGDTRGMHDHYWQTTAWLAVLTLPVFLLSCIFAGPVTTALFGHRYASSAPVLAVLSVGYYVNAALGFNGTVLQILGATRYVVVGNLATVAFTALLAVALIPPFGAVGAAVTSSTAVLVHNVVKQVGVARYSDVGVYDRRYTRVYVAIAAGVLACAGTLIITPGLPVALAAVAAVSLAVLLASRHQLQVAATFPEVLRLPVLRRLLAC
jgi:O-antigen/teichoic acid export membrane protein